jgi:hypothetical protein
MNWRGGRLCVQAQFRCVQHNHYHHSLIPAVNQSKHRPTVQNCRASDNVGLAQYVTIRHLARVAMLHRHLNHQRLTLAAIDDVISRGHWNDWAELRQAVLNNHSLLGKVEQVCRRHTDDPYAQRHHFWMNYAQTHRAST